MFRSKQGVPNDQINRLKCLLILLFVYAFYLLPQ